MLDHCLYDVSILLPTRPYPIRYLFFVPTCRLTFIMIDTSTLISNQTGLQILPYALHSWPLSNEGSLACHIYPTFRLQDQLSNSLCHRHGDKGVTLTK